MELTGFRIMTQNTQIVSALFVLHYYFSIMLQERVDVDETKLFFDNTKGGKLIFQALPCNWKRSFIRFPFRFVQFYILLFLFCYAFTMNLISDTQFALNKNNSNKCCFFMCCCCLISQVDSLFVRFFFIIILEAIATVVNMIVLRFVPRFVPMCNFCAPIYFQTFRFQIENFASLYFSFQLSALPLGTVLKHSPPCQPAQLCPPPRSQPDKSFVIVVG